MPTKRTNDPAYITALNSDETNVQIGKQFNISEHTVRMDKKRLNIAPSTAGTTKTTDGESETHHPDGTSSYTRYSDAPWGYDDYRNFIRSKGQNPDEVTFTWGWTSNPAGGFWNKLNNVKPANKTGTTITEEDITAATERARTWKLPTRTPGTGLGAPVAATLNLADLQLMKSEGGGTRSTLDRVYSGLERFQQYVERQRKGGRNVNEIVLVNNGDPYEGIAGNYASQLFTVEGGLRAQMNHVLDVWESFARELFPRFDKAQFVSVLCNHGELGRLGSNKNQTSDSDNGGALLAESLQRILRGRPEFDHVKFTIPHDQMNVYASIANVTVGFNHGHKIPGNDATGFEKWLNGQVRGDRNAYDTKVWITAHRHNLQFFDLGSASVFQCPSCDGGSKWLRDMTGKYSNSGILAMLIGEHERLGWSDPVFL